MSIFDLRDFSLDRFRTWQDAGTHWISRGISDLLVTVEGQTHDLQEWLVLTTVWSDPRVSLTKATRLIRDELSQRIPIVTQLSELRALLTRWRTHLPGLARSDLRKHKPSPQLLATPTRLSFNDELDAYGVSMTRPTLRFLQSDKFASRVQVFDGRFVR